MHEVVVPSSKRSKAGECMQIYHDWSRKWRLLQVLYLQQARKVGVTDVVCHIDSKICTSQTALTFTRPSSLSMIAEKVLQ